MIQAPRHAVVSVRAVAVEFVAVVVAGLGITVGLNFDVRTSLNSSICDSVTASTVIHRDNAAVDHMPRLSRSVRMCRLQSEVHHLLLSAAAPARCTQTQQGRYTLITWPSDSALQPVRNAQRQLLPRVNDLLDHAHTMSTCGFQLLCTAVGFVIRDTISGSETHLMVGPANAGLNMALGSR